MSKELSEYPQNAAYRETCETCRFSTAHPTVSDQYVICNNIQSKHFERAMKCDETCGKHEPPDMKTPSLFGGEGQREYVEKLKIEPKQPEVITQIKYREKIVVKYVDRNITQEECRETSAHIDAARRLFP